MTGLDWNPSSRKLRQFAAVAFVFLVGAAALGYSRGDIGIMRTLALGLGILAGLFGLLRPQALRLPFVLLSIAVYPIGLVVSQLILLVVFYGVITPLGAIGRLVGSDPLNLGSERPPSSEWCERRRPRDKASYLRQA